MTTLSLKNDVSTLSTTLLANLDEASFFANLIDFLGKNLNETSTYACLVYSDGSAELIARQGKITERKIIPKGTGLTGYVARTKRAYYTNQLRRDPMSVGGIMDSDAQAELVIPVLSESIIIGTIHFQSNNADRNYNDSDIAKINEVLKQIQNPIKNLSLLMMAKNLNRELTLRIEEAQKEQSKSAQKEKSFLNIENQKITMVGLSKDFMEIANIAKKMATQDLPILLEGAHGVGKKSFAKKIHEWSGRVGNCVTINCSTLNEAQLTQEIFSSTGALIQAQDGTLILDEIYALPIGIQTAIVNVMNIGSFMTSDLKESIRCNVRLIATAKENLQKLVEVSKFREDLYYRLSLVLIKVPSLKQRKEDIKVMAEYFLNANRATKDNKVLTPGAVSKLENYPWPGNGHELKNVMERTAILTDGQYIEETNLPELEAEVEVVEVQQPLRFQEKVLFDLEKTHILATLDHLQGNKTRAAKSLGITVKTLYNKLHSYGVIESKELQ